MVVDGPAAVERRCQALRPVPDRRPTNTVRSPASAWAWSAASANPSADRMSDQSTTVVIPASAAPSRPIRVAA